MSLSHGTNGVILLVIFRGVILNYFVVFSELWWMTFKPTPGGEAIHLRGYPLDVSFHCSISEIGEL